MKNFPSEQELQKLPCLYETLKTLPHEMIMRVHFFSAYTDFYFGEYEPVSKHLYGCIIINNNYHSIQWDCYTLTELEEISLKIMPIEFDLDWQPKKVFEIIKPPLNFRDLIKIYV